MTIFIYAIQSNFGPIKVGISASPERRLRELSAHQFYEAAIIFQREVPAEHQYAIEATAHHLLSSHHLRGEWFNATLAQIEKAIDSAMTAKRRPRPKPYTWPTGVALLHRPSWMVQDPLPGSEYYGDFD